MYEYFKNDNEDGNEKQEDNQQPEQMSNPNIGSTFIKSSKGVINCLTIIGQIEGHSILPPQQKSTKYEHVLPQLVAIEEDERIDGLLILLNTVGGDVEAGLAMAEMISGMKKPTVSLVLGGGHSIGVPLAVAAKYSFVAPSATMTIHPVRMNGLVIGVPQTFEYFSKMQDRILEFIVKNSRAEKKTITELMFKTGEIANDVGSIILGDDAVKYGLLDSIGSISDAIAKLYELKENTKKE